MKKLLFLSLISLSLAFMSCGEQGQQPAEQPQEQTDLQTESNESMPEEQGKEYTSAYICPMHCEGSGSDEPGTCPVCGMDYVAQADAADDGHMH